MSMNVFRALPIKNGKVDTSQVVYLKKMPMTRWMDTDKQVKGGPKLLSLVSIRKPGTKTEQTLVVFYHDSAAGIMEYNEAHPIMRYLGKDLPKADIPDVKAYMKKAHLSDPFGKTQSKKKGKINKGSKKHHGSKHGNKKHRRHGKKRYHGKKYYANLKLFKSMKFTMVIAGYHLGLKTIGTYQKGAKKGQTKYRPYINTLKEYNFKVNRKTMNIADVQKHHMARVLTAKGPRPLVINRIIRAKGPIAQKQAKKLMPVMAFENHGIKSRWLRNLYKSIIANGGNKKHNAMHIKKMKKLQAAKDAKAKKAKSSSKSTKSTKKTTKTAKESTKKTTKKSSKNSKKS